MNDTQNYVCYRTNNKIEIDGVLAGEAWTRAPRSPRFVDMVTGDPGYFDTRAAALWDGENLYVSFWRKSYQEASDERDYLSLTRTILNSS